MKKSLLFCLLFVLCACGKKIQSDEQYNFPRRFDLVAENVSDEYVVVPGFPTMFLVNDGYIVVSAPNNIYEGFIKVYSVQDGFSEKTSYGTQGRGPGEFVYAEVTSAAGNRLFVNNLNMSEMAMLDISEDGSKITETRREKFKWNDGGLAKFPDNFVSLDPTRSVWLESGYFAGLSYVGSHEFFSLWDDSLNFVRYFGDSPVPEVTDFMSRRRQLDGFVETHGDKFVYAPLMLPYLAMYEIESGEPIKKWGQFFNEPLYEIRDGNISFSKSFGCTSGLTIGKKYIYLVFLDIPLSEYDGRSSEKSFGNIIFVFDQDGNKVARLNLDHRVADIAVSSDERTLYGIAATPEFRFVEYKLPEFEKD